MKEKLQEYALLAEIISAIAIVASLLFVGVQLRQNDRTNQVNAFQMLTNQSLQLFISIAQDKELSSIFQSSNEHEELSPAERQRMVLIRLAQIRQSELAFLQFKTGFIDETQMQILMSGLRTGWSSFDTVIAWNFANKAADFEEYVINWLGESILSNSTN